MTIPAMLGKERVNVIVRNWGEGMCNAHAASSHFYNGGDPHVAYRLCFLELNPPPEQRSWARDLVHLEAEVSFLSRSLSLTLLFGGGWGASMEPGCLWPVDAVAMGIRAGREERSRLGWTRAPCFRSLKRPNYSCRMLLR